MCVFTGHRGTDRYKAVPPGAKREKQGEMVSGDPDHEEVSFSLTCIDLLEGSILAPAAFPLSPSNMSHVQDTQQTHGSLIIFLPDLQMPDCFY